MASFVRQTKPPHPDLQRWTSLRKAAVVTAVADGVLTREQACHRYKMTEHELLSWERALEAHGLSGLRATLAQQHRRSDEQR